VGRAGRRQEADDLTPRPYFQTEAIAARRRPRAMSKRPAGANGVLVAEGDSWFDYPWYDVLSMLERAHNFRIESVAHKGDTVEEMAYDAAQLTSLTRMMEHLQQDGRVPRAVLISGGGNDIAGDEFAVLLNHANSGLPALNARVVDGIVNERLRFAKLLGKAYRQSWENELHPSKRGFGLVADTFAKVLLALKP
jgi:hypothetical protein